MYRLVEILIGTNTLELRVPEDPVEAGIEPDV